MDFDAFDPRVERAMIAPKPDDVTWPEWHAARREVARTGRPLEDVLADIRYRRSASTEADPS